MASFCSTVLLSFSPKISLSKENLKRIVDDRMMEGERVHQRAGRFSIDASGSDDGGWSWGSRCRDGDLNINIVDSAHGLQDTGTTGHMLIGKIVYHKLGSCMPYGHRDGLV